MTSAAAATTATPIAAPPSPLLSLRRHLLCHRCAPSLRPIAALPSLRCHHNRCAATASAVVARPQQAHRSPDRPLTMPLPPERSSMMPTQQSKEMNRKVVVEMERGEGEGRGQRRRRRQGQQRHWRGGGGDEDDDDDDNDVRCTRRGRDDRHNNQNVREVRGEEEDGCGGGRDGGRGAGGDNRVKVPNEVTWGRGARNRRRAGGGRPLPLTGTTSTHRRCCAAIAVAAPPPSLSIAAPPLLHRHDGDRRR